MAMTLLTNWNKPVINDHDGNDITIPSLISECQQAVDFLTERSSMSDKQMVTTVSKGFAQALLGKLHLFNNDYSDAKQVLKRVMDSGKYSLTPGEQYSKLFHTEGNGNEEKSFEVRMPYNKDYAEFWGLNSDAFVADPMGKVTDQVKGKGYISVPTWVGNEFYNSDNDSYRVKSSIPNIVYVLVEGESNYVDESLNSLDFPQRLESTSIGIKASGMNGQSLYIPYKMMMKNSDIQDGYLPNITIMRYAEVLLMYAESCIKSGSSTEATSPLNVIAQRAGSAAYYMNTPSLSDVKQQKLYELWNEGCRFNDLVRLGDSDDIDRLKTKKENSILYDKLTRAAQAGESPEYAGGNRYYVLRSLTTTSYENDNAHNYFPLPASVEN